MPADMDDTTSAGGDDTYMGDTYDDTITTDLRPKKYNPILKKMFATCEDDALGSVHRAWAVTVLFMIVFFIVAIIEGQFIWCVVIALCVLQCGGYIISRQCDFFLHPFLALFMKYSFA